MTTSASSFPAASADAVPRTRGHEGADSAAQEAADAERARPLASLAPGSHAVVTSIGLEPDLAAWVAAVGIHVGEQLTVLRRAVFGGPIHVRTRAGGEFALARSLAHAILVRAARAP